MAKQPAKSRKKPATSPRTRAKTTNKPRATAASMSNPHPSDIPPGATRKAFDRPVERGGGAPGSGAGPRHAADDVGSEGETFGRTDMTRTPASPAFEEEDRLEIGPPYAGPSGGAVGGTPAQLRSAEGRALLRHELEERESAPVAPPAPPAPEGDTIRLTGDDAIEYAEKQGLLLNKHPDSITGPRIGLNIGEAQALAEEDPDLIWLDVSKEEYYSGPPINYEPED